MAGSIAFGPADASQRRWLRRCTDKVSLGAGSAEVRPEVRYTAAVLSHSLGGVRMLPSRTIGRGRLNTIVRIVSAKRGL